MRKYIQSVLFTFLIAYANGYSVFAQLYPKVGVNLGMASSGMSTSEFVDIGKQERGWRKITGGVMPHDSLDEQGWPLYDARRVFFDKRAFGAWINSIDDPESYQKDMSGTYKLSFEGQAELSLAEGEGPQILNKVYDPSINITRADIVIPASSALLSVDFKNTKATSTSGVNTGVKKVRLIKPGFYENTNQVFDQEFLNSLCPFSTFRVMDWLLTNGSNPNFHSPDNTIDWNERKMPEDATQSHWGLKKDGIAWEYVVDLGNLTQKNLWINIPVHASDNYIRELAKLFKNKLNPYSEIYIEHSNEVWNSAPGFEQTPYNKAAAIAEVESGKSNLNKNPDGSINTNNNTWASRRHAERLVKIGQIFNEVYGSNVLNSKIKMVLAYQRVRDDIVKDMLHWINKYYGEPKSLIYGFAITQYISGSASVGASPEAIVTGMRTGYDAKISDYMANKATAEQFGIKLLCYEGGPLNTGTANIGNKILANRLQSMGDLLSYVAKDVFLEPTKVNGELFMQFSLYGYYSQHGSWGLTDDIAPSRLWSPKYTALANVSGNGCMNKPTVTLTSPSSNFVKISKNSNLNIQANANDANGTVSKVEFFEGANKIGEDLSAPFELNWSGASEGLYTLMVKATVNGGAASFSNSVSVQIGELTAVEENLAISNMVSLYPVPANNQLIIQLPEVYKGGQIKVKVTDLNSKIILEKEMETLEETIDLSTIQTGLYLVNISNEKYTVVKKITVQK